jgi:hypothetical protein
MRVAASPMALTTRSGLAAAVKASVWTRGTENFEPSGDISTTV